MKVRTVDLIEKEFFYYVNPDNTGRRKKKKLRRKVVAGMLMQNGSIQVGVSECSHEDQFRKVEGRGRAKSNALRTPIASVFPPQGVDPLDAFLLIAKQLNKRDNVITVNLPING